MTQPPTFYPQYPMPPAYNAASKCSVVDTKAGAHLKHLAAPLGRHKARRNHPRLVGPTAKQRVDVLTAGHIGITFHKEDLPLPSCNSSALGRRKTTLPAEILPRWGFINPGSTTDAIASSPMIFAFLPAFGEPRPCLAGRYAATWDARLPQ